MSKTALVLSLTLLACSHRCAGARRRWSIAPPRAGPWKATRRRSPGARPSRCASPNSSKPQGDDRGAYKAYRALVKRYGLSLLAPKAQRKIGLLLEKHGDNDKAFDAYNIYLTKYPQGDDFDSRRGVDVQDRQALPRRRKEEGLRRAGRGFHEPRAQAMFESIVKSAPFSKYAPLAQFNVGQALEKQGKYPEAIDAYQTVREQIPGRRHRRRRALSGRLRAAPRNARRLLRSASAAQGARGVRGLHQPLPGEREGAAGAGKHEVARGRIGNKGTLDIAKLLRQDEEVQAPPSSTTTTSSKSSPARPRAEIRQDPHRGAQATRRRRRPARRPRDAPRPAPAPPSAASCRPRSIPPRARTTSARPS